MITALRLFAVAFALIGASNVQAAGWVAGPGSARACEGIKSGTCCYYEHTTTADADPMTVNATFIRYEYDPDIASATTGTSTGRLYSCVEPTASANTCTCALVDTDADGLVDCTALDGSANKTGGEIIAPRFIWFDVVTAGGQSARLQVCGR